MRRICASGSGYQRAHDHQHVLECGFTSWLIKPIDAIRLAEAVGDLLGSSTTL
jgi:CheY-like chemotaxis protein